MTVSPSRQRQNPEATRAKLRPRTPLNPLCPGPRPSAISMTAKPRLAARGQMVRKDRLDNPGRIRRVLRVVLKGADQDLHGFPNGPATAASTGGLVERQSLGEDPAALTGKERPRDRRVAGGIPDAAGAEVDHRAEPAVAEQQVAGLRVAVEPHRRSLPGGPERRLPDLRRKTGVDTAIKRGKRVPRFAVVISNRPAAEEVVG